MLVMNKEQRPDGRIEHTTACHEFCKQKSIYVYKVLNGYTWSYVQEKIPVGTLEATFERIRITTARRATPLALSIREYGSTSSHSVFGMPVLLKPSTVINIPQKKISSEYDTCKSSKYKMIIIVVRTK